MIRTKKYNNADYILIDTDIMVYEEGQVATIVPVQVQVRLKDVSDKQQKAIYKYTSLYFDRTFAVNKPQPEVKKGWLSSLFQK
jgi:hypothetical protein